MNRSQIDEIKNAARSTIAKFATRDKMLQRYKEIYFMDNMEKPRNAEIDDRDWKLTPSPASRNKVIGLQRLLNTSEVQVKIENAERDGDDAIETGLKNILRVSGEGRRARIESDASLSSVLYGSVTMYAESIADLLTIKTLPEYRKQHLKKQQLRSPFLLRMINPQESYPDWDEDMLICHTWKYKIRGAALRSRWGVKDAKDNTEYTIYDTFTAEHHVVWADGQKDEIFAAEHGLGCLPIFVAYSGGSDLFNKPDEQQQAFLYAIAKGDIDKRENSMLTTVFTNIHQRGTAGPLIAIDPDTVHPDQEIAVSYVGGMRYIKAKANQVDEKIIDPVIFQAKNLLDELSGQSTIYSQTLGENIGGNVPFSSLAMLSNSGKLPLVDSQRAIEHVLTEAFNHILYRIRTEGIENDAIKPTDITEDLRVEVSLQAKLPQDSLRNAQVAQSLGGLVSEQWKRQELLQVGDNEAMDRQVMKESIKAALMNNMLTNPQILQQLASTVMGMPNQQPAQPQAPQGMQQGMPPEPSPEEMQAMMQAGGGNLSGMENMEATPMADAMVPPEERGM